MKGFDGMIYIIGAVGVALIVVADRITKMLAVQYIEPYGRDGIPIINGVFRLQYSTNYGAAWGILSDHQWILTIISIIVSVGLVYFYIRLPKYLKEGRVCVAVRVALIMVAGGAVGNLIDRIQGQAVVDFLFFELINFPVFNVADIFIVCGAFLLCIVVFFFVKDEKNEALKEDPLEEGANDA